MWLLRTCGRGFVTASKKAAVLLFFGSFFGLERAMTYFYCRRKVKCPYCGSSLLPAQGEMSLLRQ